MAGLARNHEVLRLLARGCLCAGARPLLPLYLSGVGDEADEGDGGNSGDGGKDPGQAERRHDAHDDGANSRRREESEDECAALARLLTPVRRQPCLGLRRADRRLGTLDHTDASVVRAVAIIDVRRLAVIDRLQKDEPGAGQRDIRGMDGTGAVQPVGRCHHFGTSVFEQPEFMVEVVDRAALALAEASQDTRCQYDDPQYG